MRPKGWKLDPQWIAHYEAQNKARMEREMMRIKTEMQLRMLEIEAEDSRRRMKEMMFRPRPGKMIEFS